MSDRIIAAVNHSLQRDCILFHDLVLRNFVNFLPQLFFDMADDTRQTNTVPSGDLARSDPPPPKRGSPKHDFPKTQAGKMWDALGNPAEPANTMPGGTYNTAGGKPPELSWKDAFTFQHEGNKYSWYQAPCARDSLLVGMGSGGAVGGLRFILKGARSSVI